MKIMLRQKSRKRFLNFLIKALFIENFDRKVPKKSTFLAIFGHIFKKALIKKMRKPLLDFCLNMIFKQFQHF